MSSYYVCYYYISGLNGVATKPQKNSQKDNPGKRWNKRLVSGEIHHPQVKEIYREKVLEYAGDGPAHFKHTLLLSAS